MDINHIKQVMKDRKVTYEQLSKLTDLSISTIKKIFSGAAKFPRVDTIETIEKALGINNEPAVELSPIKRELVEIILQLNDESVLKALEIIKVLNK